jgi:predicted nuclease of predicted toxin-antitoxin system
MSILFKVDENLPVELAELLVEWGHEAKTVWDEKLQGTNDDVLIDICRDEKRVLVTLDIDFSDIRAYPPEEYEGIIVLRIGSQSKKNVLNVFQRIEPLFSHEPIKGRLWIVEPDVVRIRGGDV